SRHGLAGAPVLHHALRRGPARHAGPARGGGDVRAPAGGSSGRPARARLGARRPGAHPAAPHGGRAGAGGLRQPHAARPARPPPPEPIAPRAPWLAPPQLSGPTLAPFDQLLAQLDAGEAVGRRLEGPPGAGKSGWLARAAERAKAAGWPVARAAGQGPWAAP